MGASDKPAIIVHGDEQAQAVAIALKGLKTVSERYDVLFISERSALEAPAAGADILFQQSGYALPGKLDKRARRITFSKLRFDLLWPLAAPTPTSKKFAWGDAFIAACAQQGVAPQEIWSLYDRGMWSASWPNLDALFRNVTQELVKNDAETDVTIGSFILKHFRKQRLFWAPAAPANVLLTELTYRALHVAFGRSNPTDRTQVARVFHSFGAQELMQRASLPVHPLVAAHFALEWYDAEERYLGIDGVRRTFREYYTELIEDVTAPAHSVKKA